MSLEIMFLFIAFIALIVALLLTVRMTEVEDELEQIEVQIEELKVKIQNLKTRGLLDDSTIKNKSTASKVRGQAKGQKGNGRDTISKA